MTQSRIPRSTQSRDADNILRSRKLNPHPRWHEEFTDTIGYCGLLSGITALFLTVWFALVVIVDRKIPAVALFQFLGVELGRVFTYWKSVNQGMQLAAP